LQYPSRKGKPQIGRKLKNPGAGSGSNCKRRQPESERDDKI
jgi:hypothetical protein